MKTIVLSVAALALVSAPAARAAAVEHDFTYDSAGRLTGMRLQPGATISYGYDAFGNLLAETTRLAPAVNQADLGLTMSASPASVPLGERIMVRLTLSNQGPAASPAPLMTLPLAVGAEPVSTAISQGGFQQYSDRIVFAPGLLAPGASVSAEVALDATGTGPVNFTATAAVANDPIPGNNSAAAGVTVTPAADLALFSFAFPSPVLVTKEVTLTFSVANFGQTASSNVIVTSPLPANAEFVSSQTSQGTSSVNGTNVVAELGAIAAGAEAHLHITLRATAAGTIATTATVSTSTSDPEAANNAAAITVDAVVPTLVVLNTADAGPGSLRQAILEANAAPNRDVITFAIPGAGVPLIAPVAGLPAIVAPLVLDGLSQQAGLVEISGTNSPSNRCFVVQGGNSVIRGFILNRWPIDDCLALEVAGGNVVQACRVGTDAAGAVGQPQSSGVFVASSGNLIGGYTAAARNLLSGMRSTALNISPRFVIPTDNIVAGNFIGLDVTGSQLITNNGTGINVSSSAVRNLIGGTRPGARNVIAGNSNGIEIGGTQNRIEGNWIGLDATGTNGLGNRSSGVSLNGALRTTVGGDHPRARNVIANSPFDGVTILNFARYNRILNNYCGTDATGTLARGNRIGVSLFNGCEDNVIGAPGAGNLLSASQFFGIQITSPNTQRTTVQANLIGTDASGTQALPNTRDGILISNAHDNLIGGAIPGEGNVLAGNADGGVDISNPAAINNLIIGNRIGVTATGAALPNQGNGVTVFDTSFNTVGGARAGEPNIIANNLGFGVQVYLATASTSSAGNRISRNSIFDNGLRGLELGGTDEKVGDGPDPTDALDSDDGPNRRQNAPVLSGAVGSSVSGSLQSAPNTVYALELFASVAADASGFGEGRLFVGSTEAATNAAGNANFVAHLDAAVPAGHFITATATDPAGSTSEFSTAIPLSLDSDGDGLPDEWEQQFFGNPTSADPNTDADGDASVNLDEFLAGTDPTDPLSVLRIESIHFQAGWIITVRSTPLRLYRIEHSSDLIDWFVLQGNIPGSSALQSLTDPNIATKRRLYRIRAEQP